jgi:hypothetical protein
MSSNVPNKNDALAALRTLTLDQVDERIAELDGERASLALIRRSLVAKRRAQDRAIRSRVSKPEARR